MTALVCIPTYNEAMNVAEIVAGVREAAPEAHVLVIDDASPDGTGAIADGLAAADPAVHVLHRAGKEGLGRAYLAGFAWALARRYDVVVEMDADGSHRAVDLPALLAGAETADLVLGSRWMRGGRVRNWAWHRVLLSRGGNAYARLLLGLPYGDVTGGFRAFRGDALRRLDLDGVRSEGYCFQIDLARRAHERGLVIREVPIVFLERSRGASKMSRRIVLEALWSVTRWALERALPRRARSGGAEGASA